MAFQIWDNEKKQMITAETDLKELAREVGLLVPMDVDGIYVGMDGSLVLLDECGNSVHLDTHRFHVLKEGEIPEGRVFPAHDKAEAYAPLFPGGALLKKVSSNH